MKKLTLILVILSLFITVKSQKSGEDKLVGFENDNKGQNTATATMTSSSRLFKNPDDLTSVILIIPKGSQVEVLASDSTYYIVSFEGNDGFIYKRHAVIDESTVKAETGSAISDDVKQTEEEPKQESRFTYLENKYGTSVAARIYEGKIWKGMNSEMIRDSWGRAERISREINGNIVREEWLYKTTWLYLENNTLMGWGPVRK